MKQRPARYLLALIVSAGLLLPGAGATQRRRVPSRHELFGRIQFVETLPDARVQVVTAFPDIRVQIVKSLPTKPGMWQIVDSLPDWRVQVVDHFPDYRIQYVDAFPGCP